MVIFMQKINETLPEIIRRDSMSSKDGAITLINGGDFHN